MKRTFGQTIAAAMTTFVQRHRVLLMHLSFWSVYLSLLLYQISFYKRDQPDPWFETLTIAAIVVGSTGAIAYFNYFVLLPRYLARRQFWRFTLEFTPLFALVMVARLHLERWLIDGYSHQHEYLYRERFVVQIVATSLFITVFIGMLRFAVEWFELEARKRELANQKLTAELNFLRAQINPHFLFNTLNNLYYLAYKQSPHTTEVIAKLSQMMRYMTDDCSHAQVQLSKEIEYMQNYISLERLRLNHQIPVEFCVEGNPQGVRVAPLIFITFLENAFKHGVSQHDPRAWVRVAIALQDHTCHYVVENSRPPRNGQGVPVKSGIGLQNVHRQLALSYPDRHRLRVEESADRYAVHLDLQLP